MQSRMLSRPPLRWPDGGASHLWLDGHSILVHPFSFRTRKLSRITFAFVLSCASRREKRSLSTTPFLPNSANSGEFGEFGFPSSLASLVERPALPFRSMAVSRYCPHGNLRATCPQCKLDAVERSEQRAAVNRARGESGALGRGEGAELAYP